MRSRTTKSFNGMSQKKKAEYGITKMTEEQLLNLGIMRKANGTVMKMVKGTEENPIWNRHVKYTFN